MRGPDPRDLRGKRFGKWTVIRRASREEEARYHGGAPRWFCRCDCGNEGFVTTFALKKGMSKSCGCGRDVHVRDIAGQRFGRLTVLRLATVAERPPVLNAGAYWVCRCDCGRETVARGYALRKGQSRSCGCLARELTSERNRRRKAHADA